LHHFACIPFADVSAAKELAKLLDTVNSCHFGLSHSGNLSAHSMQLVNAVPLANTAPLMQERDEPSFQVSSKTHQ